MLGAYTFGKIGYLSVPDEPAYQYMYDLPDGSPQSNCKFDWRDSRIADARVLGTALSLETGGFELLHAPSQCTDFTRNDQVTQVYYPEAERLALQLTGGIRARVFDHQLRQREPGRPPLAMGRSGDGSSPAAVGRVHNDYTEASGARRLQMVYPDADPEQPFIILNLWRPVAHPAIDTPLAVCDARSFARRDWVTCEVIYRERRGQINLGRFSDQHRWYYYPQMQPDEVLVFKSYDSRRDVPARMTPHCAFDDPAAPPDAPLRRSIEVRCLVVLE